MTEKEVYTVLYERALTFIEDKRARPCWSIIGGCENCPIANDRTACIERFPRDEQLIKYVKRKYRLMNIQENIQQSKGNYDGPSEADQREETEA